MFCVLSATPTQEEVYTKLHTEDAVNGYLIASALRRIGHVNGFYFAPMDMQHGYLTGAMSMLSERLKLTRHANVIFSDNRPLYELVKPGDPAPDMRSQFPLAGLIDALQCVVDSGYLNAVSANETTPVPRPTTGPVWEPFYFLNDETFFGWASSFERQGDIDACWELAEKLDFLKRFSVKTVRYVQSETNGTNTWETSDIRYRPNEESFSRIENAPHVSFREPGGLDGIVSRALRAVLLNQPELS